jgi:hypothetical protein
VRANTFVEPPGRTPSAVSVPIVREQSCVTAPVGLDGFDVVSLSEPALHDHRVARGHR